MNVKKGQKGFMRVPLKDRMEKFITRTEDCWLWTGTKNRRGYGQIWFDGKLRLVHRLMWEMENGQPFPADKESCHRCMAKNCVNPAHIRPGTHRENILEAMQTGQLTHPKKDFCKYGHPLSGDNLTYVSGKGRCRICSIRQNRKFKQKRKAALLLKELS